MGDPINKLTFQDAILKAAAQVGEDGKGKDGIFGYFRRLAKNDPKSFLALLGRLPPENNAQPTDALAEETYETVEEAAEALMKLGIDVRSLGWMPEE
jgi:hypothetical protein